MNKLPIIVLDFSGVYDFEAFASSRNIIRVDCKDLKGVDCYCDEEAIAEINKRTENYPTAGIHFIDSGNYHYMTRLWLTRMDQPFCLLVYDNHTDMQPPAFGGILSCGGWIAAALEELENLKYVILVGPDEAAYEQVDENLKDRVIFLSREKLQVMNDEERNWFLRETVSEVCNWRKSEGLQEDAEKFLPLYISVDKDVLCTEDAQTNVQKKAVERLPVWISAEKQMRKRYMRMKPMIMQMKNCWRFLKVYLGNPTVNNK